MDLSSLLEMVINKKASDLHILPGYYPTVRVSGELYQLTTQPIIKAEDSEKMLFSILNPEQKENLIANREIDLAYGFENYRFRINMYYAQGVVCGSFRLIPNKIKTLEELMLPAYLKVCVDYRQGLVLLTGPTGEGKSTTLAAIINEINSKYDRHIINVEDPVEYIYPKSKSIISQRELHQDTHSWTMSLRSALREDPDVILMNNAAIATTIREGKTYLISNIIETSEGEGLLLFEKNLLSLYRDGMISRETAFSYAIRPKELEKFINVDRV